jgi:hypothetical protein
MSIASTTKNNFKLYEMVEGNPYERSPRIDTVTLTTCLKVKINHFINIKINSSVNHVTVQKVKEE